MPKLVIQAGMNSGATFEISGREMLIGRDIECNIYLKSRTVSRRHARLVKVEEQWSIEDLQSVNGTAVNGQDVRGRQVLHDGDLIEIHDIVMVYRADAAAEARLTEPPKSTTVKNRHSPTILAAIAANGAPTEERKNSAAQLQAMLDITHSLGSSLDMNTVMEKILDSLFHIFPHADRAYILEQDENGELQPHWIKHSSDASDTISPVTGSIAARVQAEQTAFLSRDAAADERLQAMKRGKPDPSSSIYDDHARSIMCAPLMGPRRKSLGVIHIESNDIREPFEQEDLDVLVSVALLAGQAVDYATAHRAEIALERHNRELDLAREVQLTFLPPTRPEVDGYTFFEHYSAAKTVAGDYYDYLELPDGRLAIVQGDVAGKGMPAALLMARLCSDVRYWLLSEPTAADAVTRLNQQLCGNRYGTFVTMVVLVLDPYGHQLTIVNAGHMNPLLRRTCGTLEELTASSLGLPLGVTATRGYEAEQIELQPGEMLTLFTDGLTDTCNPAGEMFAMAAIREHFARPFSSAVHAGNSMISAMQHFAAGRPQTDDVCLICVARGGEKTV